MSYPAKIFFAVAALVGLTLAFPTHAQPAQDEVQIQINQPQPRIRIPGVEFSSPEAVKKFTRKETDGNTYLFIPYLGEYLAAVYRYAVVVAGVWAVLIIFVHGLDFILSKGNSEVIQKSKTRIAQTLTGVTLIVGSYVLLYFINPELVQFRHLRVLYVQEKIVDIEGNPDTQTAAQQGLKTAPAALDPAACHLEQFASYEKNNTLFGTGAGYCLKWAKQAVANACGALPEAMDLNGAWDVAARFFANNQFHPCNLDGIQDGDLVFMTSIGSNWIGLWEQFEYDAAKGCTVARAAKEPKRLKNGVVTQTSPVVGLSPNTPMPPVTHIGVYYNGVVYHQVGTVEAEKVTEMERRENRGTSKKKDIWDGIRLSGNFLDDGAEFVAGYGSWKTK